MIALEICAKYKSAEDKNQIIKDIAEEECCGVEEIKELLKLNGCELPPETRGRKKKAKPVQEAVPDIVREALSEKMDEIDQKIKELEPYKEELEKLEIQYKEIADYLCGVSNG